MVIFRYGRSCTTIPAMGLKTSPGLLPGLPDFKTARLAWADYDNDGKLDLLITGQDSLNLGSTILYHNTGSGFENKTSVIPGIPSLYYSAVAFGDYDNDGYKDLVLSGAQSGGEYWPCHQTLP